jgi:hypothetical protein
MEWSPHRRGVPDLPAFFRMNDCHEVRGPAVMKLITRVTWRFITLLVHGSK